MGQTKDISIRYLKQEDYYDILSLSREVVNQVLPDERFEEEYILTLFNSALENKEVTGIVLVVDGQVEGFILGHLTPNYFHPKLLAICTAIYVRPKFRKYGLEMIKSFELWGKYKKAKTLCIGVYSGLSPKSLGRAFKKLGYTEKEINFQKEI